MSFLAAISRRFAHVALFIIFEIVAFILIINFNQRQKEIFSHSTSLFSGSLLKKSAQLSDYLSLQDSNDDLLQENARLLKELISIPKPAIATPDSSLIPYEVIPSRVVSNNIVSLRNHLTLDKGTAAGLAPSMGVITLDGVVGIVSGANENYATALSLLNVDLRVSASIEDSDYFGTIQWDGISYNSLIFSEIPKHAPVRIGAKVQTNGFSTIFPKGIEIGTVKSFTTSKNGAYFEIEVTPSVTFSNLGHVYIVKNNFASVIDSLTNE